MRIVCLVVAMSAACSIDAASPEPDAGFISDAVVSVIDDGEPVAGAHVVFHDPDGAVAGVVVADERGVATYPIEPGGMVTVAYPVELTALEPGPQLLTFIDVSPGDRLVVEIPSYASAYMPPELGPVVGQLSLALPPIDGAGSFSVDLGCTQVAVSPANTVVDIPEACLGRDDTIDIKVDALTPPDLPALLGTTFATRVPVVAGAVTDVTLPEWIPPPTPTIEVRLTDIPAVATNAFAVAVMLADGQAFGPGLSDSIAVDAESATLSPGFYTEFADQMDLEIYLAAGPTNVTSFQSLAAPVEAITELTADAMLPVVRDLAIDPEATRLTWTTTGDLSSADAGFLRLSSQRTGAVTAFPRWTITLPPDAATSFELPQLPVELRDYRPDPRDDYIEPGLVMFDVSWIDGYGPFLADYGTRFLDDPCLPVATTARLTRTGTFYGPRISSGY